VHDAGSVRSAHHARRARRRGLGAVATTAACALLAAHAHAAAPAPVITAYAGTGTTGTPAAGTALGSPLGSPQGVALDAAGDLYIADATADVIEKVTPAGALSLIAGTGSAGTPTPGPATHSALHGPTGVAVDAAGNLYIGDTGNHEVEEVTPAGTLSMIAGTGTAGRPTAGVATASALGEPSGLAVDAAGDVYIPDGGTSGNPYVEKVTPQGVLSLAAGNGTVGAPRAGVATASPLRTPTGVAVDGSGDLFIADAAANVIEKVSSGGTLSVFAGRSNGAGEQSANGVATSSHLSSPTGVAVDASGDLYVADQTNNRIEEVTPAGTLSILAGSGLSAAPTYGAAALSSGLQRPFAIAVSPTGAEFVADTQHFTVDRLAPGPPVATAAPGITGAIKQGQTLTAGPGSWTNAPSSFSYRWQDCDATGSACADIPGASAVTYTLTGADSGQTVRVVVTAVTIGGSGTAASVPTPPIVPLAPAATALPSISGAAVDAQTLTASPGSWTSHPTSYTYQWQDCDASGQNCTDIDGQAAFAYALQYNDIGDTLRVKVTAHNAGGMATASSPPTAVIAPATIAWANVLPPADLQAPAVSGAGAVGAVLACSPGQWANEPTAFSYEWTSDDRPIDGATSAAYTVTRADRGRTLACVVAAANPGGEMLATSNGVRVSARPARVARARSGHSHRRPATARTAPRTAARQVTSTSTRRPSHSGRAHRRRRSRSRRRRG